VLDGNVARVLSRLFLVQTAPGTKGREALLWALASILVEGPRPGDLNQSLMELGATVCLPSRPQCATCPVARGCEARSAGRTDSIPPPRPAPARARLELAVAFARRRRAVLLARRPNAGLFGGLWELPSAPLGSDTESGAALKALLGSDATIGERSLSVERTLTHRHLVLHLYPVRMARTLPSVPAGYLEWGWIDRHDASSLGMSSAMAVALDKVWREDPGDAPGAR